MVDIPTEDGEYEQETIYPDDIQSVTIEIDEPYIIENQAI